MPNVTANGIQIEYDTFGDSSFPALLLVAGNGAQMIFWDVEFCELLAKKSCFVIRFYNRDAGLSTKFGHEKGLWPILAVRYKESLEKAMSYDNPLISCIAKDMEAQPYVYLEGYGRP